ncbi:MAG: hypothetical protein V1848_04130, partial [Candidatus Magasanikbacteria bacterium]
MKLNFLHHFFKHDDLKNNSRVNFLKGEGGPSPIHEEGDVLTSAPPEEQFIDEKTAEKLKESAWQRKTPEAKKRAVEEEIAKQGWFKKETGQDQKTEIQIPDEETTTLTEDDIEFAPPIPRETPKRRKTPPPIPGKALIEDLTHEVEEVGIPKEISKTWEKFAKNPPKANKQSVSKLGEKLLQEEAMRVQKSETQKPVAKKTPSSYKPASTEEQLREREALETLENLKIDLQKKIANFIQQNTLSANTAGKIDEMYQKATKSDLSPSESLQQLQQIEIELDKPLSPELFKTDTDILNRITDSKQKEMLTTVTVEQLKKLYQEATNPDLSPSESFLQLQKIDIELDKKLNDKSEAKKAKQEKFAPLFEDRVFGSKEKKEALRKEAEEAKAKKEQEAAETRKAKATNKPLTPLFEDDVFGSKQKREEIEWDTKLAEAKASEEENKWQTKATQARATEARKAVETRPTKYTKAGAIETITRQSAQGTIKNTYTVGERRPKAVGLSPLNEKAPPVDMFGGEPDDKTNFDEIDNLNRIPEDITKTPRFTAPTARMRSTGPSEIPGMVTERPPLRRENTIGLPQEDTSMQPQPAKKAGFFKRIF